MIIRKYPTDDRTTITTWALVVCTSKDGMLLLFIINQWNEWLTKRTHTFRTFPWLRCASAKLGFSRIASCWDAQKMSHIISISSKAASRSLHKIESSACTHVGSSKLAFQNFQLEAL